MDSASCGADYRDDKEMRELETALNSCATEVEVRSGLDRLNKVVSYLCTSSNNTAMNINSFQQEILDEKAGAKGTVKVMILDTNLISEYLDNSFKTHNLCINELQNFITSVSKMASSIEKGTLESFQKNEKEVETNANKVVEKIEILLNQHATTLEKLTTKIKEKELASIFRKVFKVIYIGIMSAAFVCSVLMATAMAVPAFAASLAAHQALKEVCAAGAVVQTLSPVINSVRAWLDKIKDHDPNLKAQKSLNESMQAGTLEIIEELKNISSQFEKVNEMGKGASQGPLEKLKEFKEEIKKLKTATENCVSVLEKARAEVVAKYEELKRKVQQ